MTLDERAETMKVPEDISKAPLQNYYQGNWESKTGLPTPGASFEGLGETGKDSTPSLELDPSMKKRDEEFSP
jgi:hypothetical protein